MLQYCATKTLPAHFPLQRRCPRQAHRTFTPHIPFHLFPSNDNVLGRLDSPMPDESVLPLIPFAASTPSISPANSFPRNQKMDDPRVAGGGGGGGSGGRSRVRVWILGLSYAFDWFILLVGAAIGYVMGEVTPNLRPFYLYNPDIAYVFSFWFSQSIHLGGPLPSLRNPPLRIVADRFS